MVGWWIQLICCGRLCLSVVCCRRGHLHTVKEEGGGGVGVGGCTARRNHPKESPVDPDYSTHAKVFSIRLSYYKTAFSGFISWKTSQLSSIFMPHTTLFILYWQLREEKGALRAHLHRHKKTFQASRTGIKYHPHGGDFHQLEANYSLQL